jgi:hypothetical protein
MRTFKRIVAVIVVVIVILGMLAVVGGLVGSWIVNNRVTAVTLNLLSAGEYAMIVTKDGLNKVDQRLDVSHERINKVDEVVITAGKELKETSLIGELIAETIGDELFPIIEGVGDTAVLIRDTATAVDSALRAIDSLPFISLDYIIPGANIFTEIADAITDLEISIDETVTEVQQWREEEIETAVASITSEMDEWRGQVTEVQTILAEADSELNTSLDNIDELRISLPRTFIMITVGINIALLFIGIAFLSLLFHAVAYLRDSDQSLKELLI